MSLLGIEFDIRGYYIKPFYLVLGLLSLSVLFVLLGLLYITLYVKSSLIEYIKYIRKERDRYKNLK